MSVQFDNNGYVLYAMGLVLILTRQERIVKNIMVRVRYETEVDKS